MRNYKLTTALEQCLRDQVISDSQPGAVLHDFQVVLDAVGTKGVVAGGKYHSLPIKLIPELDQRLRRPLQLDLKRPQLRSHPYLQGLNLLLRASGLSRVEGIGDKARLVLDPEMLAQWNRLNPTEQYFNLLEAWLRFGNPDMIGANRNSYANFFPQCAQLWRSVAKEDYRPALDLNYIYYPGISRELYLLALMALFGIVEVPQPRHPANAWRPEAVHLLPFGNAVFTLLASHLDMLGETTSPEDREKGGLKAASPQLGMWQSWFQPYFPEWEENLEFPGIEFRKGIHVFRVSVANVWRLIAMPGDATLDDLVDWILKSVSFDHDHLYQFSYVDRFGVNVRICDPQRDESPVTTEILIGNVPLEPGNTMELWYDFGDDWLFEVMLERVEPASSRIKAPKILEKHGKSPRQYPRWDY